MRVYRPPTFNLFCRVWFPGILPDDLSTWNGLVPMTPADATFPCQLYYPRWGLYRWLHALSEQCWRSLLSAGVQELRMPADSDVQAPWGVSETSVWSMVPLVECPALSGRLYVAVLQEVKHAGFPNEYVVAVLAQIGPIPPLPPPPPISHSARLPAGSALSSIAVPPRALDLPAGAALDADVFAIGTNAKLPAGSSLGIAPPPPPAMPAGSAFAFSGAPVSPARRLPAGSAMTAAEVNPPVATGKLPVGTQISSQELFPYARSRLPAGSAMALGSLPPKNAPNLPAGSAITATYSAVVLRNPCASIGAPLTIILACTSQTGTLTGFTGLSCTLTYNSGAGNWQGTLTRAGKSGTITATSVAAGKMNFSGSSGLDWNISAALSDDTVSCGPPFSGTSGNHTTSAAGPQSGNTVWTYN